MNGYALPQSGMVKIKTTGMGGFFMKTFLGIILIISGDLFLAFGVWMLFSHLRIAAGGSLFGGIAALTLGTKLVKKH